jgi:hypothetical protein
LIKKQDKLAIIFFSGSRNKKESRCIHFKFESSFWGKIYPIRVQ